MTTWVPAPPGGEPPVVDRLDTRRLERRQIVRSYVKQATVEEQWPGGVLLATTAVFSTRRTRFDSPVAGAADGDVVEGRLAVEIAGEGTVRVRYAEGAHVPDNDTPMVVGTPEQVFQPVDVDVAGGRVTMRSGDLEVVVTLKPLSIAIFDGGREVAFIGGREKNFWNLWDSYNTGICRTAEGRPLAVETFALRPGEGIFGFGEQFTRLNKVGQTIDLNMVEATGTSTPRAYKNIPFFVSTGGYGVFLNHSSRITAWVGSLQAADVQLAIEDPFLDYYVFTGDIRTVLGRYTDLTGKAAVPPKWSFGFWQSKISYRSTDEALEVARTMREHRLPFDVLHLDTHWFKHDWYCDLEFDAERFADPKAFLDELRGLGVRVSLWQLPYIPEGNTLFDELTEVDGFVKRPDGSMYDVGISYTPGFKGRVGCIDFTNPAAREVHQRHLRRLHALGAAAIKVDFGEQAPLDGVYFDGTPGHRAHNVYPLLYNESVAEATREATGETIIWARSAWAGSQRYPLHWGGDSSATWYCLGPQFEGGLSFGLSGFSFWSQDIGGFLGRPDDKLLIRWMQAGLLQSHARIHGVGDREIYKRSPEVVDICRQFLELRYQLLPYLWAEAEKSAAASVPLARALVVDFQDDPTTWAIGDQWMLGDALLVAPVFSPDDRRRVYLPAGTWTDWWTGEEIAGGRWLSVDVPIDRVPLFVKLGHEVELGPVVQHTGEVVDRVQAGGAPPLSTTN
ncbi:MAG TPA: TIM-barrel domain-containing protein [Acidimicrobiales bacterium]|jgi:alpha-D-xyloside xylohydrolase|nr:TIM-barrel domain-containing protein [Acidimicrobiales bacterium]